MSSCPGLPLLSHRVVPGNLRHPAHPPQVHVLRDVRYFPVFVAVRSPSHGLLVAGRQRRESLPRSVDTGRHLGLPAACCRQRPRYVRRSTTDWLVAICSVFLYNYVWITSSGGLMQRMPDCNRLQLSLFFILSTPMNSIVIVECIIGRTACLHAN